jgi:hypothetical protein
MHLAHIKGEKNEIKKSRKITYARPSKEKCQWDTFPIVKVCTHAHNTALVCFEDYTAEWFVLNINTPFYFINN